MCNRPLWTLFVCASCVSAQRIPVIIDTDIGTDIDDAFAVALALKSPELDLRGITTVSEDAHTRALIACRLLESGGRSDIPVAPGLPPRSKPATKGQYRYGLQPGFQKKPLDELAVDFLYRQLKAEPGKLTLIAIGQLTNVAGLLAKHPDAGPWIKRIVIMGGSVRVGYKGKPPAEREWNIRSDVKAARAVFASGLPLLVAPLDATTMVKLEEPLRLSIFNAGGPLGRQLQALYTLWGEPTPTLYDPVAVAMAFDESFCTIEKLHLDVVDRGHTRENSGAPNAQVAVSIREGDFLDWYVRRVATSDRAKPGKTAQTRYPLLRARYGISNMHPWQTAWLETGEPHRSQ